MPKLGVGTITVAQVEQRTTILTLFGDRGNFIITDDNRFLITDDNRRLIYGDDTFGVTNYIITDTGAPLVTDDDHYLVHSGATPPSTPSGQPLQFLGDTLTYQGENIIF